jgi:hypothetical protein
MTRPPHMRRLQGRGRDPQGRQSIMKSKEATTTTYEPKLKDTARVLATYGDLTLEAREKYERPAVLQMERAATLRAIRGSKGHTDAFAAPSAEDVANGRVARVDTKPAPAPKTSRRELGAEFVRAEEDSVAVADGVTTKNDGMVDIGTIVEKPRPQRESY